MAFKKNNPGCACCYACVEDSWDASTPDDWTNVDNEWTDAGATWTTSTNGATIFLDHEFEGGVAHTIGFEFSVPTAAATLRIIFWRTGASDYFVLELPFTVTDQVYVAPRWIQVVSDAETELHAIPATATAWFGVVGSMKLYATSDYVTVLFGVAYASQSSIGLRYVTAPASAWTVGFKVVDTSETVTLTSIGETCDDEIVTCEWCSEDAFGPDQMQVVTHSFTGACAKWNGTFVFDNLWFRNMFAECHYYAAPAGVIEVLVLNVQQTVVQVWLYQTAPYRYVVWYVNKSAYIDCGAYSVSDVSVFSTNEGCWSGKVNVTAI